MGRKRVYNTSGVSNPLQKFFGVYLRIRRKTVGLSAEQIARSLCITPTYYRMSEAGQNPIRIGLVSDLIGVFVPKNVYIDFSSLAALLTAIAIVEKSLINEIDLADPFRALTDYPDLKTLLEEIRPCLALQKIDSSQQKSLETKAYNAVRDFLETTPGQRETGRPHLSLEALSKGGEEVLRDLHRQLIGNHFLGEKPLR